MKIQIQFISADVEDKGKYKMAEIAFKDLAKGQVSSKKLMSFGNPTVYKTLVDAKKGEVYEITMEKNDKGFWDWTAASISNSVDTSSKGIPDAPKSTGFASPKSTYETPEERAKKQVYIVRQSSLGHAIETLKTDKKVPTKEEVVELAQFYEGYVFGVEQQPIPLADLPPIDDDEGIPF